VSRGQHVRMQMKLRRPFLRSCARGRASALALFATAARSVGCAKPAAEPTTPSAPAVAAPSDHACSEGAPATPEHCECLGGYVKGDIGDGQVACPQGETELERVQQGIEGAVCCKAAAAP
jgi:hypothetical protein